MRTRTGLEHSAASVPREEAGESRPRSSAPDLALAEELARRAALAVDDARLSLELRAAMQAQDEWLASIMHDLRNPLGIIKGYSHWLRRQIEHTGRLDLDRALTALSSIDAATARMTTQINELLDLAPLQLGEPLRLKPAPVDLVALVTQLVVEHQGAADSRHIRFETDLPEIVGTWDSARLQRVLANLLANAIKYSPSGGEVAIRIAREDTASGSWAVVAVRDEGLGIPATDLPHIFERFHRAENVAGRIGGTGLGLAGARQIVEQHGGTIAALSVEGSGSTFTVRLPLTPDPVKR